MKKVEVPSWDQYFMTLAYLVSMRSKDDSTHIGAVIVGPDNEVRSMGYNGFPRGIQDWIDGQVWSWGDAGISEKLFNQLQVESGVTESVT